MKKILFVLPYYKIGGTLTSFSNLIPLIDNGIYDISAFALTNDVYDVSILPSGVNYIGLNVYESTHTKIKNKVQRLLKWCKLLVAKIGYDPSDIVFKKMAKTLSGKYDVVIAYQEGQATRMAQYIDAPEKIAWVHCVYSRFKELNKSHFVEVYNNFDKIVCVSHTAAKDMVDCEPRWENKIRVVYNAIDNALVNTKAASGITYKKKINFVSIGRIDPVKRFTYIPQIASKLKNSGLDFDWWVIGGPAVQEEYDKLLKNIKLCGVDNCVHALGAISNPYPYIKSCNLLICLSFSETFNYTIAEAKALGIPIISTDFPSAFEFVKHEQTGLILPIEEIANGIMRILNDCRLYSHIRTCLNSNTNLVPITKEQFQSLIQNV